MRPISRLSAVVFFFVVLSAPIVVSAQADVAINYQPMFGVGFATDQEVQAALGTLKFSMTECKEEGLGSSQISVRVTSTKWAYQNQRVIDTMLYRAAQFAWQNCQIHFSFAGTRMPTFHREVDSVRLYMPDGSEALLATNLRGDDTFREGKSYRWLSPVVDVGEQNRQEVARRSAQAEQERQRAEAYARYQVERDRFWSNVWRWIKLIFWGAIAAWLFSMRETIMRWYYFLTPHPAEAMVEAAMHRSVELDGKAFADIMRPVPGGRIEKEVRSKQALILAEKAHRYAESMRAEADRIKAEAERETEFIKAQDELTKAAIVHEKAKARLDALRKRMG